jgi:hypothetical protein
MTRFAHKQYIISGITCLKKVSSSTRPVLHVQRSVAKEGPHGDSSGSAVTGSMHTHTGT